MPGLFPAMLRSPQDWQYFSKDKNTCKAMQGGCWCPRGKCFCGTPAMNVMYALRGSSHIYDLWEKDYDCDGWSFKDVLPYFKKSEGNTDRELSSKYHCFGGPLKISYHHKDNYTDFILNGVTESGYPLIKDINAPHESGICRTQGTVCDGRRFAVCKAFVNPIQYRSNLKIVKCAIVTRILFDGKRAIGVEFDYKGKLYRAYANKEVILCAGSIGTPLILQLSGIGLPEDLKYNKIKPWLQLPVGRNLQDHFAVWMWLSFCGDSQTAGHLFSSINGYYSCPRTGDFAGIGTLPCVWFYNTSSNSRPHIEAYFFLFTKQSLNLPIILALLAYYPPITNKLLQVNQEKMVLLAIPSLLDPKSRGFVRLDGVNGPKAFDNPYIFFKYLFEQYDRIALRQAMQIMQKLVNSPTWKAACAEFIRLPLDDCDKYTDVTSDEYCDCYLGPMGATVYHPVGTCKMGKKWTPRKNELAKSVVNPECQVHGTYGLSIADASM